MSILVKGAEGVSKRCERLLPGFVELLEKGDLLGYGEFLAAAAISPQTKATTVIGTPLAMVAVGAGMFFITGLHPYILRVLLRSAQVHGFSGVVCVADKDIPLQKILQQVVGK